MRNDNTRRKFLQAAGSASLIGLAGCLSEISGGGSSGPIRMGSLCPVTGAGQAFGGGQQEAINLAVEHINEAGGPLDREIDMINKDSESRVETAVPKYNELVNEEDIIGFVGESFSGVSIAIAKNIVDDEVMQVSPSSTSPVLADMGWNGDAGDSAKFFARTCPNDIQQGVVMGKVLNEDQYIGADTAAFLYRGDPYGEGLAEGTAEEFEGEVTGMYSYSKDQSDFTSTLDKIFADDPDAVGLVTSPTNARNILTQWHEGGYGGQWVASEGLDTPDFFEKTDEEVMNGLYFSSAAPADSPGLDIYHEEGGSDDLFAPHSYDAVFLQALAIHKAGEATGLAISEHIQEISRPDGETVTVGEFDKAKDILDDGDPINYEGASSPVDLNQNYEPFTPFSVKQVEDGDPQVREELSREWFDGKI